MATRSNTAPFTPAVRSVLIRRRLLFYMLAVVAPSVALIVLSVRMIGQERELSIVREQEEREQLAREFGQIIALSADRHFFDVPNSSNPSSHQTGPVVLTAFWDGHRLVMPWDTLHQRPRRLDQRVYSNFYNAIANAERFEFSSHRLEGSAREVRRALSIAPDSAEYALAATILSRLLSKMDQHEEAATHRRAILDQRLDVVDEFGVPFAFYAAENLTQDTLSAPALLSLVDRIPAEDPQLSPQAGHLLSAILDSLRHTYIDDPGTWKSAVESAQRYADVAIGAGLLQQDFPRVNSLLAADQQAKDSRTSWTLYHGDRWLVGRSRSALTERSQVIVLDASSLVEEVANRMNLAQRGYEYPLLKSAASGDGQWLGPSFPGVYATILAREAAVPVPGLRVRYAFIILAMLLVVGLALIGTMLWWRFTAREIRLAQLRSDFVSSVSHELKTPLTSIRMFAETLRFRTPPETARNTYLDTILAESGRLTRLLNNVLDFSRIEKDSKLYQFEPIVLQETIESALAAMSHPLNAKNFKIRTDLPEDPVVIPADRDAIEQVLLNLLSNAVKFSDDRREIHLALRRGSETATIEIRDFGIGIRPEDVDRIFSRFYRSNEAVRRGIAGTGLGLPIVRHAVEAHRGHITVNSTPGEGTTVAVHLPINGPP